MKYKNIFIAVIAALGMISFSSFIAFAQTSAPASVGYPIAELGGCKDQSACKDFCAKGENMLACVNFAEKKGMLSGEDLRISKIVAQKVANKETPGGCSTKETCESFCQGKVDNINECIAFGEELGVIPKADLAEAKQIAAALSHGAKMPGSCKTKGECETFCSVGSHIDECLNFAEAAGILPADQLAEARKVAPYLKSGETPGKCATKESCDAYCKEDSHFEECVGFAEKVGFISPEDAVIAKKVGGKGPGGCQGKDACLSYCDQEEHAAECANFAKEKGLLTKEQEDNINTGVDRMIAGLDQIPAEAKGEVTTCLENSIGKDKFDRIIKKMDVPTQSMGGKIEACFGKVEEIMKAKMMPSGGIPSGAGAGGGSAPTKEEIMKNIPANVPASTRENIQKQIEQQMSAGNPPSASLHGAPPNIPMPPSGVSSNIQVPPSAMPSNIQVPPSGAPAGIPAVMPNVDCSAFKAVPSFDYVQGPAHDFFVKCKGN